MPTIEQIFHKIRAVLLRRGVSADDTEDYIHEAFLRVSKYEARQQVKSKEAMLLTTAVNISRDHQRRQRRAPFADTDTGVELFMDLAPLPDEILNARIRLERLRDGLNELNEKTRRILLMRRLDGISVAEIARQEGMSRAAVEKQIARATWRLMTWMQEW